MGRPNNKKKRKASYSLHAPYRFIPLSGLVYSPPWAERVSQDAPFEEGLSGTFDLEIEAKTPIFTRDDHDGDAFLNHKGKPFIKGSTLRGMLRNTLAIATFGKFQQVDERRFGVRDLANAQAGYLELVRGAKAGWLRVERDEDGGSPRYFIQPCSMARAHFKDLEKLQKQRGGSRWSFRETDLDAKYGKWKGSRVVTADLEQEPNNLMARNLEKGSIEGTLVFTGYVPDKKREFFFYHDRNIAKEIKVSEEVFWKFEQAHSGSQQRSDLGIQGQDPNDTWRYWRGRLEQGDSVPVFYIEERGKLTDFGLASMFRLASRLSTHEAIRNVSSQHLETSLRDLPELIFGRLPDDATESALKGRVSLGPAWLQHEPRSLKPTTLALSSPRPSFYPAYLKQEKGVEKLQNWLDRGAQSAGWKRYPATGQLVPQKNVIVAKNKDGSQNKDFNTTITPLDAGSRFRARVNFHNLLPEELGALLWCIDFNGLIDDTTHRLGMAKAYGYGQVTLRVNNLDAISNHPERDAPTAAQCLERFEDTMLNWFDRWLVSEPIVELLATCSPSVYGPILRELKFYDNPKAYQSAARDLRILGHPEGIEDVRKRLEEASEQRLEKARERARAREAARRASMTPAERALEDLEGMSEDDVLEYIRENKDNEPPLDEDVEAMRQRIRELHAERWLNGDSSAQISPKKLREDYLPWVAPDLLEGDDADQPSFDDIPLLAALSDPEDQDYKENIVAAAEGFEELNLGPEALLYLKERIDEFWKTRGRKMKDKESKKLLKATRKKLKKLV